MARQLPASGAGGPNTGYAMKYEGSLTDGAVGAQGRLRRCRWLCAATIVVSVLSLLPYLTSWTEVVRVHNALLVVEGKDRTFLDAVDPAGELRLDDVPPYGSSWMLFDASIWTRCPTTGRAPWPSAHTCSRRADSACRAGLSSSICGRRFVASNGRARVTMAHFVRLQCAACDRGYSRAVLGVLVRRVRRPWSCVSGDLESATGSVATGRGVHTLRFVGADGYDLGPGLRPALSSGEPISSSTAPAARPASFYLRRSAMMTSVAPRSGTRGGVLTHSATTVPGPSGCSTGNRHPLAKFGAILEDKAIPVLR